MKIHIKSENKGKNSPFSEVYKYTTFSTNARTWKHKNGGVIKLQLGGYFNPMNWGKSDYSDLDFKAAYAKAKSGKEEEFMWKGNRYTTIAPEIKNEEFGLAWNEAKKKGLQEFMWKGKTFSTESIPKEAEAKYNDEVDFVNQFIQKGLPTSYLTKQDTLNGNLPARVEQLRNQTVFKGNSSPNLLSITTQPDKNFGQRGYSDNGKLYIDITSPTTTAHEYAHLEDKEPDKRNTGDIFKGRQSNFVAYKDSVDKKLSPKNEYGLYSNQTDNIYLSKPTEIRARFVQGLKHLENEGLYKRGEPVKLQHIERMWRDGKAGKNDTYMELATFYGNPKDMYNDFLNSMRGQTKGFEKGGLLKYRHGGMILSGQYHRQKNDKFGAGNPIIAKDGVKVMETEREELIFTLDSTKTIEGLMEKYKTNKSPNTLIELGKYVSMLAKNQIEDKSGKFIK